ncbi:dehydrogenase E1 component subunit alpha/beta [soil metagenome]
MIPPALLEKHDSAKAASRLTPEEILGLYRNMALSRILDDEEIVLKKRSQIFFQISAAGHEAIGVAAGFALRAGYDWFYPYYRDRALCLQLGMTPYEMLLGGVGADEDPNSGSRQMPCHWGHRKLHIPSQSSPTGTQYNQAVGCAEAGRYIISRSLALEAQPDEITLVTSGEGATSEGEFWEAINVSANRCLPVLFLVEDNEYAISVPVEVTTAGGDIGAAFSGVPGLRIIRCDGTDLFEAVDACEEAVRHLRDGRGPVLLHAKVTRPYSHSLSDDQIYYRTKDELESEKRRDCLTKLEQTLVSMGIADEERIAELKAGWKKEVRGATERALAAKKPSAKDVMKNLYSTAQLPEPPLSNEGTPSSGGELLPMGQAINRTMLQEMELDERIIIFGEDVADASRCEILTECQGKGGVFNVTKGLQLRHGADRVFNTPIAEAMIVGRGIGMAVRGLKPVVEIQFFDYIWPAFMQLRNELATMRYRSAGSFSAPVVVRAPIGGYINGGGPYHSQSGESIFVSCPGIKIAYPSNAADAMGLLRSALRMDDPVLFLEHKHLYYQGYNRSTDPGPDHLVPFGEAAIKRAGTDITLVTWGALVQRSLEAADRISRRMQVETEVIDIRTLVPFDRETVMASVRKTGRLLIAHEEMVTGGFGAEIAAQVASECFEWLDAPIRRVGAQDTWVGYSPPLEKATLPQVADVEKAIEALANY